MTKRLVYWDWGTGFIFIRVEGFGVRHVGTDALYRTARLSWPFTLSTAGGGGPTLVLDVNRLLAAPGDGAASHVGSDAATADQMVALGTLALRP